MNKKYFLLSILFFTEILFPQKVLQLADAIEISKKQSYQILSAELSLENSRKNLEAIQLGLRTSVNLEFDLPRFSRSLQSQFNPITGNEQFFEIGTTTLESRLYFTQPIAFTNGTFSLVGFLFGRDQLSGSGGVNRDYYSNLSLRFRQPLFTFNALSASLERAEINLEKSKRNFVRAEKELIYNVTSAFYSLYQLKKEVEIAEEKLNQTNISYETAQNKFKAGLIAEVEALQLEVDLAQDQNDLLSLKMRFEEYKNNFKLLIGLPLDDNIDVEEEIVIKDFEIKETEAVNYAYQNRPDLFNAEADIRLNSLTIDEVASRGNISALLNANYGINKNDTKFENIFRALAEDRSVTFTVSLPVWDWGKNDSEVEAAEANLKSSQLSFRNQKDQIRNEIISIINKIKTAKARLDVLMKSAVLAQKSYDITVERFKSGTITSFDLTQMQIRLTDAKTNKLKAMVDYKLALAELTRRTLHEFEK